MDQQQKPNFTIPETPSLGELHQAKRNATLRHRDQTHPGHKLDYGKSSPSWFSIAVLVLVAIGVFTFAYLVFTRP